MDLQFDRSQQLVTPTRGGHHYQDSDDNLNAEQKLREN